MWREPAKHTAPNSENPLSMYLSAELIQDHRMSTQMAMVDLRLSASIPQREEGQLSALQLQVAEVKTAQGCGQRLTLL